MNGSAPNGTIPYCLNFMAMMFAIAPCSADVGAVTL
jgi:hypothetical protein